MSNLNLPINLPNLLSVQTSVQSSPQISEPNTLFQWKERLRISLASQDKLSFQFLKNTQYSLKDLTLDEQIDFWNLNSVRLFGVTSCSNIINIIFENKNIECLLYNLNSFLIIPNPDYKSISNTYTELCVRLALNLQNEKVWTEQLFTLLVKKENQEYLNNFKKIFNAHNYEQHFKIDNILSFAKRIDIFQEKKLLKNEVNLHEINKLLKL